MTSNDPITALADQLAVCGEQLTRLDAREAAHYTALTALLTGLTAHPAPGDNLRSSKATSRQAPRCSISPAVTRRRRSRAVSAAAVVVVSPASLLVRIPAAELSCATR